MSVVVKHPRHLINQHGMVLVIVLWIITLLAVMAGSFAYSMRVETRLATSTVERAQARALADAGIVYAMLWQLDPEAKKQWPPNGDSHEWMFGGGQLRIEVTNASGLVNLNTANTELLKVLLKTAGVDAGDQDNEIKAILDWRGSNGQRMPGNTENAASRLKGAWFESIEELGQVPGISRELYAQIAPVVTVYSPHYGVNPELAPAQVLSALGLDERTITDYVQARIRTAADGSSPPLSLPGNNPSFFSQSRSNAYHITVTAKTESGTAVMLEAVFDTQGGTSGQELRLLSWREGSPL